jgi:hypothetical protein
MYLSELFSALELRIPARGRQTAMFQEADTTSHIRKVGMEDRNDTIPSLFSVSTSFISSPRRIYQQRKEQKTPSDQ